MTENYPKILPWVASKAGVRGAKAEILWMEALRDASDRCSVRESSEYWKVAVDHLLASLAFHARAAPTPHLEYDPTTPASCRTVARDTVAARADWRCFRKRTIKHAKPFA